MTARRAMAIAGAVLAAAALAACSGPSHTARGVQSPQTTANGLRQVHSPGKVTDDLPMLVGMCHFRDAADGERLPDPVCTPGAVDPAVTQATIATTICVAGWTMTVRPSSSVTGRWKRISQGNYGLPDGAIGEYDHLVPLELGGANTTSNLWLEPGTVPNSKDRVEDNLKAAVCAGTLLLQTAQAEIARDWTVAKW